MASGVGAAAGVFTGVGVAEGAVLATGVLGLGVEVLVVPELPELLEELLPEEELLPDEELLEPP